MGSRSPVVLDMAPSLLRAFWKARLGKLRPDARVAGVPVLHLAIKHQQRDVVRKLLALAPSARVLQQALELVVKGSLDDPQRTFMKPLLRAGAAVTDDLLIQCVKQKDPAARVLARHLDTNELMHDMVREDNPQLLAWLLTQGGAKVDYRCEGRATALIKAAQMGRLGMVKQLLRMHRPPRLNLQSSNGSTALHRAAAMGHLNIVKLLVAKRAKSSLVDAEGRTALMLAASAPKEDLVMIRLLLAAGSPLAKKDSKGQTALTLARQRGFKKTEHLLLKLQAKQSASP